MQKKMRSFFHIFIWMQRPQLLRERGGGKKKRDKRKQSFSIKRREWSGKYNEESCLCPPLSGGGGGGWRRGEERNFALHADCQLFRKRDRQRAFRNCRAQQRGEKRQRWTATYWMYRETLKKRLEGRRERERGAIFGKELGSKRTCTTEELLPIPLFLFLLCNNRSYNVGGFQELKKGAC